MLLQLPVALGGQSVICAAPEGRERAQHSAAIPPASMRQAAAQWRSAGWRTSSTQMPQIAPGRQAETLERSSKIDA
jgi:hypothetical protein